ncbi:hypothetical protein HMPREF1988_01536 [Porphyromonas gingivalis F0185]|nr:hypothetical protein HMPREF1988_01536 [Porphyromonas gingivalis F0185]
MVVTILTVAKLTFFALSKDNHRRKKVLPAQYRGMTVPAANTE